jgi:hypothetical protein
VHSIHSSTPTTTSSSSSGANLASLASSSSGAAEQQLWTTLGALPSSASRDLCSPADLLTSRSLWHSLREVSEHAHPICVRSALTGVPVGCNGVHSCSWTGSATLSCCNCAVEAVCCCPTPPCADAAATL